MSRSKVAAAGLIGPFFLILSVLAKTGCAASENANLTSANAPNMEGRVKETVSLSVEVTSFQLDAIHDDFADRSHGSYDLTTLTVIEPGDYHGAQLKIIHPSGVPYPSDWKVEGRRCRITIESWLLDNAETLIPEENVTITCEGTS